MCGIAGYIDLSGAPVSSTILQRMTDAIIHRGPDSDGHWLEENVALGHRRLSIIDLSAAGNQPMISANKRYILSYNGEVYNFLDIRRELEHSGHVFRSNTDTEVVLNALIEWGVCAIKRFNGMFAFVLWDREDRILYVARDRYGIKPIYYSHQGNTFAFGSEQKAITAIPYFNKNIDKSALLEYFTFQNIFTSKTLLEGISLFPAGHFGTLNLNAKNPTLELTEYWDFNFTEPSIKISDEEYGQELDRLFYQAVNRQLVADVELGSYLSGGIDSGSITAVASKSHPYLKTFTCGFDLHSASGLELAFDERSQAEFMSYCFKTEHYEMVLKAGDMERALPKLVKHLEEPRVGQSYPNYYAALLASKFVKVVLSGAGGDELFGGYPWRYYRAVVNDDFDHYIDKYYQFWQRLIPNNLMKQVFNPIWDDVKEVCTRDIFRDVFQHQFGSVYSPEDYINHSLYFEAKTFLHGLLVVEDKLSMAQSLESRVPFLDNDLVDFAMRCPVRLKINNLSQVIRVNENEISGKNSKFFTKNRDGKQILRHVMKRYIPEKITQAEKQGFTAPDASWFKGESIEFVKKSLLNKNAKIYSLMDYSIISTLINEHLTGTTNHRLLIWSLLSVETWLNQC
jgi:asparagine synthase (glutamine-hydrolysing)